MQMSELAHKHDVFQAVADHNRRKIVRMLADQEMSITAIVRHFSISRTAVNKHLNILSDAGMVNAQKIGREVRYKLRPESLYEIKKWISFYERYWDERLLALKDYVENEDKKKGG
jgi:DNA-binding transcriptional ArsR family regulator